MHHALEEMRPRRVAYRYVRTWFAVDLVCSIPHFGELALMKSGAAAKRLANVVTLTFCDLQARSPPSNLPTCRLPHPTYYRTLY